MKFNIKFFTLLLLLAISFPLFAQDDDFENYSFDDNSEPTKLPYFALSIGGTSSFLFMDYDDINKKPFHNGATNNLWKDVLDDEFSGPMVCWGFDFFTALSPLLNNFRIGINYETGSKSLEMNYDEADLDNGITTTINLTRKLSVSSTGLHFDYAWVPLKSLAILPGIGVKLGAMGIEQYATSIPADWNGAGFYNGEINEKIEYTFMAFEPKVNIEYALTSFLMLRASASYVLTIDNPFYENAWTINGNNEYTGAPDSVKPQGFAASIGLFLGLFNY
ncbi:MAG: hypothetical protein LBO69_06930 [Ignavibacteria bacterium]|jgi:hypothetical protein|nr:hypothetical protein [Ignavibacteria bacterium]